MKSEIASLSVTKVPPASRTPTMMMIVIVHGQANGLVTVIDRVDLRGVVAVATVVVSIGTNKETGAQKERT